MKKVTFLLMLSLLFIYNCSKEQVMTIDSSNENLNQDMFLKKGGNKGNSDVVLFDVVLIKPPSISGFYPDYPTLVTDCPGSSSSQSYGISWPKFSVGVPECVVITPILDLDPDPTVIGDIELTNDPFMDLGKRGNKLTKVSFKIQDVVGSAGILYKIDGFKIQIPVPEEPSQGKFTAEIRKDKIEVWQYSGHIGGKRVKLIGYISIGDIIYSVSQ